MGVARNSSEAKKSGKQSSRSGKRETPQRVSAARLARQQAGLSLEEAARRAHCTVAYLRRLELQGGVSWVMGMRLAHIYGCNCQVFLYK